MCVKRTNILEQMFTLENLEDYGRLTMWVNRKKGLLIFVWIRFASFTGDGSLSHVLMSIVGINLL